jgi:hypothetical protein
MSDVPLTPQERQLFNELIVAAQALLTVSRNAATVLSEEYESMITGPASVVEDVLNRCPAPTEAWDGEFREADCDIEYFTPDVPEEIRKERIRSGVKVTHRQTKLSVSAYQSADPERNYASAMRVLQQRVQSYFRASGESGLQDPLR